MTSHGIRYVGYIHTKLLLALHMFLRNLVILARWPHDPIIAQIAAAREAVQEPGQFHSEASVRVTVPDARVPILLGETQGSLILLNFND
jgi:hypothetical protein